MVKFDPDNDIPDLTGKVVFVTGGNTGLGKETVRQLSKHKPDHIFLAARSESKARDTISEIQKSVPNAAPISFVELDLGSFESVKQGADAFRTQSPKLDLLINNAGIMACPPGLTKDGYEVQFGTNHMGHALLTKLLLPSLQEAAKTSDDVRIVTLTSDAEAWTSKPLWDFDAVKTDMSSIGTMARYGNSKLANILYTRALSRQYPEIRCISVHPGAVQTELSRGLYSSYPLISRIFLPLLLRFTNSVDNGARNQLWAAVSVEAKSGEFYHPVGVTGKGSKQSEDKNLEDGLWEWTNKELEGYE